MQTQNRMGTMPMKQLIPKLALPLMASMLIQALYNIVDSIFVAKISNDALTAVSLAFPVQMLMIALGVGTGVGINSLISRRLGAQDRAGAHAAAVNGVFLCVLSAAAFFLFGLFFARSFAALFTANQNVIALCGDYLSVVTVFSFGLFLQLSVEKVMQGTGNTLYHMYVQGTGAIINLILDPVCIFALGLGVRGAAIATVAGQIIAMALGFALNQRKNKELKLTFRGFRPDAAVIRAIYRVGLPSIVMQSIGSVMTMGLNRILEPLSAVAVSVLGVYFKLNSFAFMPVFGLSNALVAIVGYNYGAKNRRRIEQALRWALGYALAIMAAGTLVFHLAPGALLSLFEPAEAAAQATQFQAVGVPALRIISLSFLGAAVGITVSTLFQGIGCAVYSLVMSVTRQLVVLLPCAYFLSRMNGGLPAVWFSFLIAELASLALLVFLYRRAKRTYLDALPAQPPAM